MQKWLKSGSGGASTLLASIQPSVGGGGSLSSSGRGVRDARDDLKLVVGPEIHR